MSNRALTVVLVVLAVLVAGAFAFSLRDSAAPVDHGDTDTSERRPAGAIKPQQRGTLNSGVYKGRYMTVKLPKNARQVEGFTGGSDDDLSFSAGPIAIHVRSMPAPGISRADIARIYGGSRHVKTENVAGRRAQVQRTRTPDSATVLFLIRRGGRLYNFDATAPRAQARSAERLLRRIAADLTPTKSAAAPSP